MFVNDRPQSSLTTSIQLTITESYTITATFVPENEVDVWDGSACSESLSGTGTTADPYLIQNCADWAYLCNTAALCTAGHEFRLTKHLDFNNKTTPYIAIFKGFFDGNNKTFMNVSISGRGVFQEIQGLKSLRLTSTIFNFGIVSGKFTSTTAHRGIVGTIAHGAAADFDAFQWGTDNKTLAYMGSIMNCYNYADMGNTESGGIFGRVVQHNMMTPYAVVMNCYFRGSASSGIFNSYETRLPVISSYSAGKVYTRQIGSSVNTSNGYTNLNVYFDEAYDDPDVNTSFGLKRSADKLKSKAIIDTLNITPIVPAQRMAWLVDPNGAINGGLPYLNEAYRVYSVNPAIKVKATFDYHPYFAYKGDSYRFRIAATDPAQGITSATVKVNGQEIVPNEAGEYYVENVSGILEVAVEDVVLGTPTISVWDNTLEKPSGDGSNESPFLIEKASHYAWVAYNLATAACPASSHIKLDTDIDFNDFYVPMMGYTRQSTAEFTGTFDGNGHILYNLNIARGWSGYDGSNFFGMFIRLKDTGTIKKLRVEGGRIHGNGSTGGLVGYTNGGAVSESYFKGSIVDNAAQTGGLIGQVTGKTTLTNCFHRGSIYSKSSSNEVGALIGKNNNGTLIAVSNYAANNFYTRLLFNNLSAGSANNFFYNGTEESETTLKSQATLTALNQGQGKWIIDPLQNNGFPTFGIVYFTITVSANAGGAVSPSADVTLISGENQSFVITPDLGYEIKSVTVNGVDVGTPTTLDLFNVTENKTVVVTFAPRTFKILTIEGIGGHVTLEAGSTNPVVYGENATFNIVPEEGYTIQSVLVDDVDKGAISTYTFTNVTSDSHVIEATFKLGTSAPSIDAGDLQIQTIGQQVRIDFPFTGTYKVTAYDMQGRSAGQLQAESNTALLPLSKGIFLLKIEFNGQTIQRKIVL